MDIAHRGKPVLDFAAPPGVVDVWIDADTGLRAGADCPHVMRESFVPSTEPRMVCTAAHENTWFGTEHGDSTGALPYGGPDDYGPAPGQENGQPPSDTGPNDENPPPPPPDDNTAPPGI
jgi:hypothetical protein